MEGNKMIDRKKIIVLSLGISILSPNYSLSESKAKGNESYYVSTALAAGCMIGSVLVLATLATISKNSSLPRHLKSGGLPIGLPNLSKAKIAEFNNPYIREVI